jgi:hypothetical protein
LAARHQRLGDVLLRVVARGGEGERGGVVKLVKPTVVDRPQRTMQQRSDILSRDAFTCQFCGSRPGNEQLHVDHLLPWSLGGSEDPANLTTACSKCNLGKLARIRLPERMYSGPLEGDGFRPWMLFGSTWRSSVCDEFIVIEHCGSTGRYRGGYWIPHDRVWEKHDEGNGDCWDWERHMRHKAWMRDGTCWPDFVCALRWLETIARKPVVAPAEDPDGDATKEQP